MHKSKIEKSQHPLIVICGPTASGKTSLAVEMALRFNGEIISADSRQVYRGLDLGSGKDIDEYDHPDGSIPFHLIDIADPMKTYSLYHYINDFHRTVESIINKNTIPIACGGSGLYIEAVLKNFRVANVPENVTLRKSLINKEKEHLIEKLKTTDGSLYSATDLSSKKRIVRAIEVALHKKNAPLKYTGNSPLPFTPLILAVSWPRDELRERINKRLQERIEKGMVQEVIDLIDAGISPDRLISLGMEYKFITEHVSGRLSYEKMVTLLQTAIHRLAKRQMTWFRGMERRGLKIHWLDRGDPAKAGEKIEKFLSEFHTGEDHR